MPGARTDILKCALVSSIARIYSLLTHDVSGGERKEQHVNIQHFHALQISFAFGCGMHALCFFVITQKVGIYLKAHYVCQ